MRLSVFIATRKIIRPIRKACGWPRRPIAVLGARAVIRLRDSSNDVCFGSRPYQSYHDELRVLCKEDDGFLSGRNYCEHHMPI